MEPVLKGLTPNRRNFVIVMRYYCSLCCPYYCRSWYVYRVRETLFSSKMRFWVTCGAPEVAPPQKNDVHLYRCMRLTCKLALIRFRVPARIIAYKTRNRENVENPSWTEVITSAVCHKMLLIASTYLTKGASSKTCMQDCSQTCTHPACILHASLNPLASCKLAF